MNAFDWIAEQRIGEAIARGDFDDLPGAGRPLPFDEAALLPPELRMAYRIVRNAGLVPAELDDPRRRRVAARLALLEVWREARRPRVTSRGRGGCP